MSRAEVKYVVYTIMADNVRHLGRRLAKPRITSLKLVKPGVFWPNPADPGSGARYGVLWWAVGVKGTLVSCGATTCGSASRGGYSIADVTGQERGGWLGGHVTIIPVNQLKPCVPTEPQTPFCGGRVVPKGHS